MTGKCGSRINNYLSVGAIVWLVEPEEHRIEIYVTGQPVKLLWEYDTLDGGMLLPGFTLPVKDIFPE